MASPRDPTTRSGSTHPSTRDDADKTPFYTQLFLHHLDPASTDGADRNHADFTQQERPALFSSNYSNAHSCTHPPQKNARGPLDLPTSLTPTPTRTPPITPALLALERTASAPTRATLRPYSYWPRPRGRLPRRAPGMRVWRGGVASDRGGMGEWRRYSCQTQQARRHLAGAVDPGVVAAVEFNGEQRLRDELLVDHILHGAICPPSTKTMTAWPKGECGIDEAERKRRARSSSLPILILRPGALPHSALLPRRLRPKPRAFLHPPASRPPSPPPRASLFLST
ncbi:hypothetical protein B0H17DRAFT_467632 [Mycena rosella]|uniref:Uncharacterized protein n=1 Tax=Mycena rosella TaxID=1033263 RepID=A0AAD7FSH9_MYCRO|nr:hypothetical protein B0H17DRAFT_467632 [Mycena rosella]